MFMLSPGHVLSTAPTEAILVFDDSAQWHGSFSVRHIPLSPLKVHAKCPFPAMVRPLPIPSTALRSISVNAPTKLFLSLKIQQFAPVSNKISFIMMAGPLAEFAEPRLMRYVMPQKSHVAFLLLFGGLG